MKHIPRRIAGGYIDRDHLDKALGANADMTALVLDIARVNMPPALATPMMRFAALLTQQAYYLHQMQAIRSEPSRREND